MFVLSQITFCHHARIQKTTIKHDPGHQTWGLRHYKKWNPVDIIPPGTQKSSTNAGKLISKSHYIDFNQRVFGHCVFEFQWLYDQKFGYLLTASWALRFIHKLAWTTIFLLVTFQHTKEKSYIFNPFMPSDFVWRYRPGSTSVQVRIFCLTVPMGCIDSPKY